MRYLLLVIALASAACGGNKSTGPTPTPTATLTRIITVAGNLAFGEVNIGQTADRTFTITNSGTATLTFTSLTCAGGTGPTGFAATPTSGTVGPGATTTINLRFSPTVAQFYSCVLSVVGDQTSGGAAINLSGTGIGASAPPVSTSLTLTGTVTDGTSRGVLPNVTVQITAGVNSGRSTVTDGGGNYALTGLTAGAFTLSVGATSYQTTTQQVTLTTSTRVDLVLQRTAASPAPPPTPPGSITPSVEYRITGTARRCSATYENSTGGTNQAEVSIPFSYSWSGARARDFLYMSCQISTGGDTGFITIGLYRNGTLIQSAMATGFPNIATVSGSY